MKLTRILILTALLLLVAFVPAAQAEDGKPPTGVCPSGFVLHPFMDHMMDHDHHIGLVTDLNESGSICVKHLSSGQHVHVDDVIITPE